jgi:ABC-type uncharacterized transport system ATPase subunit
MYGEVLATGTLEEIRANPAVQEAYLGTLLKPENEVHAGGSHA